MDDRGRCRVRDGFASAEQLCGRTGGDGELMRRFEYLSKNDNSNCSRPFMESIPDMLATALIQGSCCSPMDAHRYVEQVKALEKYRRTAEIPPDPYDIAAGHAAKLMTQYELPLSPARQATYEYAMEHSNERGPCCCQCWRWHVYGGLAKQLITAHGFPASRSRRSGTSRTAAAAAATTSIRKASEARSA
jgi:hypothetical protein